MIIANADINVKLMQKKRHIDWGIYSMLRTK